MIQLTTPPNQAVTVPFSESDTGAAPFTMTFLIDGVSGAGPTPTYVDVGGGLHTAELTFTSNGLYTVIVNDVIIALVTVEEATIHRTSTLVQLDAKLNTEVVVPFAETVTGAAPFTMTFLKDGVSDPGPTPTYDAIGGGIHTASLTFTESGLFTVIINDAIVALVNSVDKEMYEILNDLDDVAQGSWVYDKAAGTLQLIKQNGDPLADFNVVDNVDTSSRERI